MTDALEAVPAWGIEMLRTQGEHNNDIAHQRVDLKAIELLFKGLQQQTELLQARGAALEEGCPDCAACAGFAKAEHLAEQVARLEDTVEQLLKYNMGASDFPRVMRRGPHD